MQAGTMRLVKPVGRNFNLSRRWGLCQHLKWTRLEQRHCHAAIQIAMLQLVQNDAHRKDRQSGAKEMQHTLYIASPIAMVSVLKDSMAFFILG